MTKFPLKGGSHTEVVFWTDKHGKVHVFPTENARLIREEGTEEARKALSKVLGDIK